MSITFNSLEAEMCLQGVLANVRTSGEGGCNDSNNYLIFQA